MQRGEAVNTEEREIEKKDYQHAQERKRMKHHHVRERLRRLQQCKKQR